MRISAIIVVSFLFFPLFVYASESPWVVMAEVAHGGVISEVTIDQSSVFSFSSSLLAFVAAGGNPDSKLTQSFIDKYYTNNQIGSSEYLNDDFWGILALRSAGVALDNTVILNARSFIEKAQQSSGGWSWSPTYPVADTDDTAAAMMALLESGVSSSDPMMQRALVYLKSAQNVDGGFPNVPPGSSNTESTAWVVSALWKVGENPNVWSKSGKDPMAYLRAQKKNDGSFGGVQATAFATIALEGKSYPVRSYVAPAIAVPQQEQRRQEETPKVIVPPVVNRHTALQPPVIKQAVPAKMKMMKKVTKKPIKKIKQPKKKFKKNERIRTR